ncbi:hypothetical protein [Labrenzia sp. VG12]|uniref:hypothetical protein n=1 Tax=Labrenzia sp. VG12 TaxID=2021862 RepID=UPI000B8C0B25|nr:hypothetical protein [Labrenzia sp. VG12]ASP32559.1 hypothetical protein CHH27_04305 [Labrenzia sp. VG12]
MSERRELRIVKTPGSMSLPKNIKRQYQVFAEQSAGRGSPVVTFNLDQPELRGVTEVKRSEASALTLTSQQMTGSGRWQLTDKAGETLAEISGQGLLSQGWVLSCRDAASEFELVNPQGLARQIAKTMLQGETEGLVLKKGDDPIGWLTKQHRSAGGGVLAGLKRFVEGRDWVLKLDDQSVGADLEIAFLTCALVAVVALEFSSPD